MSRPLTELPAALLQAGFNPPNYRTCYEMARSARLPVTRKATGRWSFDDSDLPAIAAGLGLQSRCAA